MSAEDLARVTGKKRFSKQVEWFRVNFGFRVVQCGDGSPVVTWATFEALQQKRAGIVTGQTEQERPALRPVNVRGIR